MVVLADAVVGAIISEFLKSLITEAKKFCDFTPLCEDLVKTMENLIPYTMAIEKMMKEVGVMDTRMENVWEIFQRAEQAIYEYPTVSFLQRSYFARKVEKINNDLLRFCQTELQFTLLHLMVLNTKERDAKKKDVNAEGESTVDVPSWMGASLKELDDCIPSLSEVTRSVQKVQCSGMEKLTHLKFTILMRLKVLDGMVFETKRALQNLQTSSMVSILHAFKMMETFKHTESEIRSLLIEFEKELAGKSSSKKRMVSAVTYVNCGIGKKKFWSPTEESHRIGKGKEESHRIGKGKKKFDIGVPTHVRHESHVTFDGFRGYSGFPSSEFESSARFVSRQQLWYLLEKADNEEAPAIAEPLSRSVEIPELESFYFTIDDISELESFFFPLVDNSQGNTTSSSPLEVIIEATPNKSFLSRSLDVDCSFC